MQRHWSQYIPDEALDASRAAGVNYTRIPVGYWMWDAPVSGCTGGCSSSSTAYDLGFNHEGFATGGLRFLEAHDDVVSDRVLEDEVFALAAGGDVDALVVSLDKVIQHHHLPAASTQARWCTPPTPAL